MHLSDCFIQLMAYVAYFQKNAASKQPPFEQVKADVQRLLSQSEASVAKGLFSQDEYDLARFMVCAWVDEMVLGSDWTQKNLWQREQLQRLYYNTTDVGEEVFEKLNSIGLHQRDVREVYYLCLALGFKGRFIHPGDEYLLEQLKTSNLKLLLGSSMGIPSLERAELFPEAFSSQNVEIVPQKQKFRFSMVTIAALCGPVVLFGLLFLIYRFSLSGIAENFLRTGF